MGAETSTMEKAEGGGRPGMNPEEVDRMTHGEFNSELARVCKDNDLAGYTELWELIASKRSREDRYDFNLISDNCMKFLRHSFRHHDASWREVGVRVSRTFFHLKEAREKFVILDFVGSMMLITMPDDKDEVGEDGEKRGGKASGVAKRDRETKTQEFQLLAAETILEMADYVEFMDCLCSSSVLNFLCIVLNQVPAAVETATHVFVKISANPENLPVFSEGAVGDILESFFKSVDIKRPQDGNEEQLQQWARDITALSHCAHTMGTMIKYDHACQVSLLTIGEIFAMQPNNARLIAELSRLFYWILRTSQDIFETLMEAAPNGGGLDGLDRLLAALQQTWAQSVDTHNKLLFIDMGRLDGLQDFLVDDLDNTKAIEPGSDKFLDKVAYAEMRLCYLNCLLWVMLPVPTVRWKLRDLKLEDLHHAFELREDVLLQVIIGTVRHLLDTPGAQECHELIRFFGEQLLILLDLLIRGEIPIRLTRLLLDGISILAFNRGMQTMLADFDISKKLHDLVNFAQESHLSDDTLDKIELAVLRILAQVAIHPSHRLGWIGKSDETDGSIYIAEYPPRGEFQSQLEDYVKSADDSTRTISSLLLTIFQERKFQKDLQDIETTIRSILDWWQANSTMRYEEEKEAAEAAAAFSATGPVTPVERSVATLQEQMAVCLMRQEMGRHLTSIDTLQYCAPYECVIALTMFSRLALEPKFKRLIFKHALEALLGCICTGIWPEAREAAATLANLMWLPGLDNERLVCWLKFDGPRCLTVDAANVLLPIRTGDPKPVDIGKGMYRSTWGVEFVEGSSVCLHPRGLKTFSVPGLLTSASPLDTFENTSASPYLWLDEAPDPRHFTVTCWFYWPLGSNEHDTKKRVLMTSSPPECLTQLYVSHDPDEFGEQGNPDAEDGVWVMVDHTRTKRPLRTPRLNPGWHMLSIVSSTAQSTAQPWDGTKFFLDDWNISLKNVWILNDFYMVGNSAIYGGKHPFGLIADFRIYARSLSADEVEAMARAEGTETHPDSLARRLASMDAATILAQRLDVPDSAAECLRALGSLATVASQRAKIFNVCGQRVLQLLESPSPILQRLAARLLNNLT